MKIFWGGGCAPTLFGAKGPHACSIYPPLCLSQHHYIASLIFYQCMTLNQVTAVELAIIHHLLSVSLAHMYILNITALSAFVGPIALCMYRH